MKEYSKDKLLNIVKAMQFENKKITTEEIAHQAQLSRSVTSNYLSQLWKEGRLEKIETRPVYWKVSHNGDKNNFEKVFQKFVGYKQSHQNEIQKCIQAVKYPTNGLPLILFGSSGTGKSFLSQLIFEYAKREKVISEKGQLVILNCANYANNPELLSSVLFGYEKGAYTGAEVARQGMLEKANGGFLFLDEVHRLSGENQEKLFTYMDSGYYSRLGSSLNDQKSNARLIFATTESVNSIFLTTFLRRIPSSIHLKDFSQRPLDERYHIVEQLLKKEAQKLKLEIVMQKEAVSALCHTSFAGNIGTLKNIIKLCCAEAFTQKKDKELVIDQTNLSNKLAVKINTSKGIPAIYTGRSNLMIDREQTIKEIESLVKDFLAQKRTLKELINGIQSEFKKQGINYSGSREYENFLFQWQNFFHASYGLNLEKEEIKTVFYLYDLLKEGANLNIDEESLLSSTEERSFYLTSKFFKLFLNIDHKNQFFLSVISSLYLINQMEKIEIFGLLVAHGSSTATSIRNLVNNLCNTFVFEAFNLPFETTSDDIAQKVLVYLSCFKLNNKKVVLMIDMGSLSQLYSTISKKTNGDVLVIDNLSTTTALDMGLKITSKMNFEKIIQEISKDYQINIQYYEGLSFRKNIIVSCVSGVGIAEKMTEIFEKYISTDKLDILTLDYLELEKRLEQTPQDLADNIAIFSTTDTDFCRTKDQIQWINIYHFFDEGFSDEIYPLLSKFISKEDYLLLTNELFRMFSLEGIAERLVFLKPEAIFDEIEDVIKNYELYYKLTFDHVVKINLYMHIAFMIERILVKKSKNIGQKEIVKVKYKAFREISKKIFDPIEQKFNIIINDYEISMLYELMKQYI